MPQSEPRSDESLNSQALRGSNSSRGLLRGHPPSIRGQRGQMRGHFRSQEFNQQIRPPNTNEDLISYEKSYDQNSFQEGGNQYSSQNRQICGQNQQIRGQSLPMRGQSSHMRVQNPQIRGQNPQMRGQNPQMRGQNPQMRGQNLPMRGQNGQMRGHSQQRGQNYPRRGQLGSNRGHMRDPNSQSPGQTQQNFPQNNFNMSQQPPRLNPPQTEIRNYENQEQIDVNDSTALGKVISRELQKIMNGEDSEEEPFSGNPQDRSLILIILDYKIFCMKSKNKTCNFCF